MISQYLRDVSYVPKWQKSIQKPHNIVTSLFLINRKISKIVTTRNGANIVSKILVMTHNDGNTPNMINGTKLMYCNSIVVLTTNWKF